MISFIRVDDRIIHGQIVTRWSKEYPCDGIIAVNDKAAATPVLTQSFKASTDKKVFVWTKEHWREKAETVKNSNKKYFLITKNPVDMKELLVDDGFVPNDVKTVVIGPCNDRPGATKLGQNQSITQEEAEACEALTNAGYTVLFALLKETAIGTWDKFRSNLVTNSGNSKQIKIIERKKGEIYNELVTSNFNRTYELYSSKYYRLFRYNSR